MMLKNGFLVSCSYDRKIFFWDYFRGEIVHTLTRKKEEFKCMAYLEKQETLLVGTNGKSILTFDISKMLKDRP
jgi:WD40 repeat protein